MNKRQKLKNGILFKKCNSKHCWIFRVVVREKFTINNTCYGCRHKETMDGIIKRAFEDIKDTTFCQVSKNLIDKKIIKRYPYMYEGKCLGMTIGNGRNYSKCNKCDWQYKVDGAAE